MLKVLDLFSGIGGFSLGLERAGMETVAFCEIDKKARLVLNKHWPDVPVFEDVSTLTKDALDARGISVDVICGGFPCQDISLAGKGAGLEGERSGLWFQFHRLIKEIQPQYAIIENVSALRSRGLDQVLRSLAEIGYDAEWHCIPASAVGAPHRRDRIWIVAHPSSGEREARTKEPRILRSLPQDGAINDYLGGRGATHSTNVAHPDEQGLQRGKWSGETTEKGEPGGYLAKCSKDVAYPTGQRPPRPWESEQPKHPTPLVTWETAQSQYGCFTDFWTVEPNVGRVANGVPNRVDRLKQLGNAVVPQIPELIGRAIINNMGE